MRKTLASLLIAVLLAAPVGAATLQDQSANIRPGAFFGARLKLALSHRFSERPKAEIAFAPTQSRVASSGLVRTRIGEGLAISLASHSRPTVTLAGTPVDAAFSLAQAGRPKTDQKLGLGTGGWIAVGVGTVLVVGVIGLALWADHVNDCEERENGC